MVVSHLRVILFPYTTLFRSSPNGAARDTVSPAAPAKLPSKSAGFAARSRTHEPDRGQQSSGSADPGCPAGDQIFRWAYSLLDIRQIYTSICRMSRRGSKVANAAKPFGKPWPGGSRTNRASAVSYKSL